MATFTAVLQGTGHAETCLYNLSVAIHQCQAIGYSLAVVLEIPAELANGTSAHISFVIYH